MDRYLNEMRNSGYNENNIDEFHRIMIPWLLSTHGINKKGIVLDIGAGFGHCVIPLKRFGYNNLIAVDRSSECFNVFRINGIKTLLCNIESNRLKVKSNSVNAVLAFHLVEHISDPKNMMLEYRRILVPNGKVFMVTPDWRKQYKSFWRDPTHVKPYDKESISRLFRMYGFKNNVFSWNSAYGFGRIGLWKIFPKLGMIGADMLIIGTKK